MLFLQKQSEDLWELHDNLHKNCSMSFLRELLEENHMNSRGGESDVCTKMPVSRLFTYELIKANY